MEPIILKFTPMIQDYVTTAEQAVRRKTTRWHSALLLVGFGFLCLPIAPDITPRLQFLSLGQSSILVMIFGLLLVLMALSPVLAAGAAGQAARRQAASSPAMLNELTYQFDDETVTTSDVNSRLTEKWAKFSSVVMLKDHYLLFHAQVEGTWRFVPRRAFETPEQESAFRDLLARKLGFKNQ